MATLAITIPVTHGQAGSALRALAKCVEQAAASMPDALASGASTVLTIDNAPATGVASVAVSAGPYTSATFIAG